MDRPDRRKYAALAALIGIAIGYAAHFRLLDARLQDDAFISFRYARHLVDGAGLTWNPGERVEGYTNLLWTLLMALPQLFSRAAPVGFARALSGAAGYATLGVSFLLVRRLAPRAGLLALAAPALLAGSWPFAINTMTGLETIFFGALITTATLLLVHEHDDLRYRGSSVVYALAALTRPEAAGLFLVTFGVVALGQRGRGLAARRYLARLAAPFAAIVGAHEVLRIAYYGAILPNTFSAKFGVELPPGLPTRGAYLADFLVKGLDPLGLTAALAALFMAARIRDARARILSAGVLFGFANVALGGADFMIGYRYLVPYVPLICVAAALGAAHLVERGASPAAARWPEAGVLILTAVVYGRSYAHSRDKLGPFEQLRRRVTADTCEALGRWMGANLPAGTVVVARDIGEIGFLSDLPIVDMSGLTDRAIARRPGNVLDRELDLDDLFGRSPGAFVLVARAPGPQAGPGRFARYSSPGASRAILTDPRMEQGFALAARYPAYDRLAPDPGAGWRPLARGEEAPGAVQNSYFLELYLRKDLAATVRAE